MDKEIYDVTIRIRNFNKIYVKEDYKELHFRKILDEKEVQAIIKIALELARREIISIKDIIID